MPYEVTKPSVMVQCETCCARSCYSGTSVAQAKFAARDDGWKLFVADINGRGKCYCPDCARKRNERKKA